MEAKTEANEDVTVVTVLESDDCGVYSESVELNSPSITYRSGRWEAEETTKLVELWRESVLQSLRKYKTLRVDKDVWRTISRELARINLPRPPEQCQIRIKNLLQQCRYAKQADAHFGKAREGSSGGGGGVFGPLGSPVPIYIEMINEVLHYKERVPDHDTAEKEPADNAREAENAIQEENNAASPSRQTAARYGKRDHEGTPRAGATTSPMRNGGSTLGGAGRAEATTPPARFAGPPSVATISLPRPRERERVWRDTPSISSQTRGRPVQVGSSESDVLRDVIRLQEKQLERFYEIETKRLAYEQERLAADKSLASAIVEAAGLIAASLQGRHR